MVQQQYTVIEFYDTARIAVYICNARCLFASDFYNVCIFIRYVDGHHRLRERSPACSQRDIFWALKTFMCLDLFYLEYIYRTVRKGWEFEKKDIFIWKQAAKTVQYRRKGKGNRKGNHKKNARQFLYKKTFMQINVFVYSCLFNHEDFVVPASVGISSQSTFKRAQKHCKGI